MARTFARASSQYAEATASAIGAAPTVYSMSAWYRPSSIENGTALGMGTSATTSSYAALGMAGDGRVFLEVHDTTQGSPEQDSFAGTMTNGEWGHIAGVQSSNTNRVAYLNGIAGTANTVSIALSGLNRTTVGALVLPPGDGGRVSFAGGDIGECAAWNVALTASEILALSRGANPRHIRPASLIFYTPLWGTSSPERDYTTGQQHLTLGSAGAAPTVSNAHPRVGPIFFGGAFTPVTTGALPASLTGSAAGTGSVTGSLSAGVTYMGAGVVATAVSGDVTADYPIGTAAPLVNDILLCDASSRDNVALSFPAGWTKKAEANNGAGLRKTIAWRRRVGGDSETSVLVTHADGAQIIARAHCVRGVIETGDPFEAATGPTSIGAGTTGVFPNVTSLSNGAMLLYLFAYQEDYTDAPTITNAQGLTLTERDSTEVP